MCGKRTKRLKNNGSVLIKEDKEKARESKEGKGKKREREGNDDSEDSKKKDGEAKKRHDGEIWHPMSWQRGRPPARHRVRILLLP